MENVCKKLFHDEKGSVIVETATAIVVIMCVFLAGIYFLTIYRMKIVMEMAAKEGSRQFQVTHSISKTYKELEIGNVTGASVTESERGVTVVKNIDIRMPVVGNYLFNLKASADFHKESEILYYK